MTAELGALFPCERFAQDFPRGMPLRTCLRRQLERQASVKRGVPGPPRRPFCAEQCALGRENRARLPGLALSACPTCGAALIATTTCDACTKPARVIEKQPPSTRLWTPGVVPDVAIAAVHTSATPTQAATARRPPCDQPGESPGTSPASTATPVNHQPPAQPAEESAMPRGIRADGSCPGCGTKSTRCKTDCPQRVGAKTKPPSKATRSPKPAPTKKPTPATAPLRTGAGLDALDVPALLARRAQLRADLADLDAALRARAEKLEADHKALLAELGSAA